MTVTKSCSTLADICSRSVCNETVAENQCIGGTKKEIGIEFRFISVCFCQLLNLRTICSLASEPKVLLLEKAEGFLNHYENK